MKAQGAVDTSFMSITVRDPDALERQFAVRSD